MSNFIIKANANGGRLEAFSIATDGALWHTWQDPKGPGGWSGWSSLGHPNGISISNLVVAENARTTGPLEAFAVGSDGAVWHIWQGGGHKDNWSNWESLGAPSGSAKVKAQVVVAENAGNGTLEAFTIASDGALWHDWQAPKSPGGWNGWSSLDKPHGVSISQLSVAENNNTTGPLEAFAVGSDGSLWHIWQGGGHKDNWSNWESLSAPR